MTACSRGALSGPPWHAHGVTQPVAGEVLLVSKRSEKQASKTHVISLRQSSNKLIRIVGIQGARHHLLEEAVAICSQLGAPRSRPDLTAEREAEKVEIYLVTVSMVLGLTTIVMGFM
jgi:hypothetical protein